VWRKCLLKSDTITTVAPLHCLLLLLHPHPHPHHLLYLLVLLLVPLLLPERTVRRVQAWLRMSLSHCSTTVIRISPRGTVSLRELGNTHYLPPHLITTS